MITSVQEVDDTPRYIIISTSDRAHVR